MSFESTETSLVVAPVDAKLEYRMYTQVLLLLIIISIILLLTPGDV